jgi:predicted phosphate transport protein (TIGR00153 family)
MAFSLLPREDTYFLYFTQMTEKIQEAADILVEMMDGDGSAGFGTYTKRIKDVEHACDAIMHQVTTKLNKSFVTPFDREDIYTLSVALDDICDYIDAGARAIVMYDIREFNNHSRQLARVIQKLSVEINAAVAVLKTAEGIKERFVEIHRLENEADDVYFRAIGELFQSGEDTLSIIKMKELYEILENATDRCESVANIIESIILKHN